MKPQSAYMPWIHDGLDFRKNPTKIQNIRGPIKDKSRNIETQPPIYFKGDSSKSHLPPITTDIPHLPPLLKTALLY